MSLARKYDLIFFTATVLEWKQLLAADEYKDIIMDSLSFMVREKRIQLNAFVIMNHHVHFIWQALPPHTPNKVQLSFMKFTAQTMIFNLKDRNPELLKDHYVGAKDRKYQIWERNPLSVGIWTEAVLKQKLDYIHNNPVEAGFCSRPEEYQYSSAGIYLGLPSQWQWLVTPCFW